MAFFTASYLHANDPLYPSSPPPHPRHLQSPPTHPSNAHRRASTTYLNCEFNDTKHKAEQGDIKLQLDLGRCFYFKVGNDTESFVFGFNSRPPPPMSPRFVPEALEILSKSIYWLKKAAELNNSDAQFYLAKTIYLKESIQHERKNKIDLIREKINSKRNNCIAYAKLSPDYPKSATKCYSLPFYTAQRNQINTLLNWANGKIHKNEFSGEAASWMRSAANTGHIRAQFKLAQYLILGTGVAIDYVEAQAWRIVAANQDPVEGNEIRYRLITKKWLTDDEIIEAKILGRRYEKEYSDLWKNPSVIIIHD